MGTREYCPETRRTHDFQERRVSVHRLGFTLSGVIGRSWFFERRGNHVMVDDSMTITTPDGDVLDKHRMDTDRFLRCYRLLCEAYEGLPVHQWPTTSPQLPEARHGR